MTDRERILAAIRGEVPDRLPWAPRLEFWHRARIRRGTLPADLCSLSLMEIADRLGVAYYQVIPDFTEGGEMDMVDRGLGLFSLPVLVYHTELDGVDRRVTRRGSETIVEYHTPVGSIRTATVYTEEMLDGGASTPWTTEHAIREPRDFETVGYIFSRMKVKPRYEGYLKRREEVGERGIVVAYLGGAACPVHHIMKELMPVEQFFFAAHDCPEAIEKLAAQMEPFYEQMKQAAADSPAEVVLLGANYDDSITYPPFFRKHILPALKDYAETLHRKGMYLMTHTDGENRKLMPMYLEAGFDVADSVCPHPMTSLRLEDILEAFRDRIAIWGGVPAILLCESSASEADFRAFIDGVAERYGSASRFILGVSDMVTADAEWDRMQYITERVCGG
jgi:uroporphyrinogen-III decarboxylase